MEQRKCVRFAEHSSSRRGRLISKIICSGITHNLFVDDECHCAIYDGGVNSIVLLLPKSDIMAFLELLGELYLDDYFQDVVSNFRQEALVALAV